MDNMRTEYCNFRITDDEYFPIEFFDNRIKYKNIGTKKFRIYFEFESNNLNICTIKFYKDFTTNPNPTHYNRLDMYFSMLDEDLSALLDYYDEISKVVDVVYKHTGYDFDL